MVNDASPKGTDVKKTYNFGELREYAVKMKKALQTWERGVEVADMILGHEATVSALRDEEGLLKARIGESTAMAGRLDKNIKESIEKIRALDSDMALKQKQLANIDSTIMGNHSKRVKEMEDEFIKKKSARDGEIAAIDNTINRKKAELTSVIGSIDKAKGELKTFKDSLRY